MLIRYAVLILMLVCFGLTTTAQARRYGEELCYNPGYYCMKVKRGDSWRSLWPDPVKRDIVKRLNRMNVRIHSGMRLAVPKNLSNMTVWDISPFVSKIQPMGGKAIIIDQQRLAWGAYDAQGTLIWWGPASPGKDYCPDVGRRCHTVVGEFSVYRKNDAGCISSKFPIGRGGAKMPHCMFFHRGYALHGSPVVPGYRASHGCIRLFNEDAEWLNKEFIDLPIKGQKPTKVIVLPI